MKMIKSTRTTSTRGVTLMSERAGRRPRRIPEGPEAEMAMLPSPLAGLQRSGDRGSLQMLFGDGNETQGEFVHQGIDLPELSQEIIVGDDGGNGGDESGGGRSEEHTSELQSLRHLVC